MPSHQYDIILGKTAGEISPLRCIGNQKICVSKIVGNIPDRHVSANKTSRVNDGSQGNFTYSKGKAVLSVRVNDGVYIRTCLIDRCVNESFNGWRPAIRNRLAVESEFQKVAALY